MIRSWGGPRARWTAEEDAILMAAIDELGYVPEAAQLAISRGLCRSAVACDIRLKAMKNVRGESGPLTVGDSDPLLRALVRAHGPKEAG